MTSANVCPQCGKPLPSDGPKGLCPECLLKAALPGQSVAASSVSGLQDTSSTAALSPEAGLRLKYFGDYELLEEIARGGMGVVWKARQSSLNRDVALKMIRAGALARPDEVERFLREAEAAANLQHPNIVAIHEVGEHEGQHYFSMDYVAGRDLGAIVKDGPLSPQVAARYVKIIAEAIHFAHQRGTLHRDLKPQNVLIDAADQPRITDFGLAKLMQTDSRLTQSGVVMGSPSYMPPEQAAGRHADVGPASDVYALGAMLYELLTGQAPFRGPTPLATLRQVMEDEPAAPRRLKADIPLDLETICLMCLEKAPAARYPTARALAEELDRFLKAEPIHARPASVVRKALSWARRHPGALAAGAALLMVALALGLFYLFEENAFLRAQQANRALTRAPGPRHESVQTWSVINLLVFVAGLYALVAVTKRARGLSFKEWFDPNQHSRPWRPLDDWTRGLAIGAGIIMLGSGIVLLAKTIQAHVWEGESILAQVCQIYASIFFGLAMLSQVLRDYRLAQYGAPCRNLTAEQIEPIRQAMEDYDVRSAIKHYRQAVPDADLAEARDYVIRLAESLRAQHGGKFVPPPLSLATLNWHALLICALIEIVVLAVIVILMPALYSASSAAQFGFAFLFGLGVMASQRVRSVWRRLLFLVSAMVLLTIGSSLVRSQVSLGWFLFGFACGTCLMVSGFTRRRTPRGLAKP